MHRKSLVIPLLLLASAAAARTAGSDGPAPDTETADTVIVVDKVQVTAIKQGMVLRSQPVAASIVGSRAIEAEEHRGGEKPLANGSQLPRSGLRFAHDLVDLRAGPRRAHRPAGHRAEYRQRPGAQQGQLRHGAGRRRTHRGPARPPVDALRPQHDGRRGERLHALAAHLRGRAADGRIRQRGFLPLPGIVLLQAIARPRNGRDGLFHPHGRLLRQRLHGREMRLGASGRRTLENAVAQQPGSAHRQHLLVLGARPGRLSLRLRRRGHRARRQDRHPQRPDQL